MYDIPIYTVTINVFKQITDLSLEFESPDGFFSNTNVGISKLSLYLDLGTANEVDSEDIFKDLFNETCFKSLHDMKEKINFFLNNTDKIERLFLRQQKNFETDDLNYKTIKKIENFIKE